GIRRLVYINPYKDQSGVDFLRSAGIDVVHFNESEL
ncbi:MAG TPA: CMP deaminase, partial [Flavobacteriales bacterium]|nr:CMP deaminase [Flavobacteriales bacterium]